MKELNDKEMQKASLLLEFLRIAQKGITKPYDPAQVLSKLTSHNRLGNSSLGDLDKYCSRDSVVRDAKDLKPYILAALDEFSAIMGLTIRHNNY
jgi:hypothetical protein